MELKNKLVIIYLSIIPILILTGIIDNTDALVPMVFLLLIVVDVYTEQLKTISEKMKYAGFSILFVFIEISILSSFFFIIPPLGYFAYIVLPILLLFFPLIFVFNSYIYNKYLVKKT